MPYNYNFDAARYQPLQELPRHPIGTKFQAQIVDTTEGPNKENTGRNFSVTFQTQHGKIPKNYSYLHTNGRTTEIAHQQMAALCYAIGIQFIDLNQDGANIRGAWCLIDVTEQKNADYNQVSKIYDMQGNEPGKGPGPAPAPAPAPQQPPAGYAAPAPAYAPPAPAYAPPAPQYPVDHPPQTGQAPPAGFQPQQPPPNPAPAPQQPPANPATIWPAPANNAAPAPTTPHWAGGR